MGFFSGQSSDLSVMDQTTKKGSQMNLRFSVKNKRLQKNILNIILWRIIYQI